MANKNDDVILQLKNKIDVKKESLGKFKRPTPITNLSIELDGVRKNINTLNKEQLELLAVKLNTYRMSAHDIKIFPLISGFTIGEWLKDIQDRLFELSHKEEEKKLKEMEAKLEKLLSEDKKVELELQAMADLLKD